MPRTARAHAPGALVHLVSRFVDGRFLFDDVGRAVYLDRLERGLDRSDWRLISYALMSSHVHLGLIAGEASLTSWIHAVHLSFAQWLNRHLSEDNPTIRGHVFADRPKTLLRDPSRAGALVAYHHNNPVRAKVAPTAAASAWTSHRAYLGLAHGPRCLDVSLGLSLCGFGEGAEERMRFHELVVSSVESGPDEEAVVAVGHGTREPRVAPALPRPGEVVARVCSAADVPLAAVQCPRRSATRTSVRRTALRVWRELGGHVAVMAAELGISRAAASRLLSREPFRVPQQESADTVVAALRPEE